MESGTRLGHYTISSLIGKGGMGEVYQAKDEKLGRQVAIKILPEEFAKDADRVARFRREAQLLASLNHPNIAAIHGLEEIGGKHFLVLELVEGPTLADRIAQGAIPIEESLKLALQIADALKVAHDTGVIHRDLKPLNIKVTDDDTVKVLDFGLAKALAADESDAAVSNSPTLSMAATQQGLILGTAAYMSPEQAKGCAVDKRTDIFAFGCVLYEMLTGCQSFGRSDVTESLSAVISLQPEWTQLPRNLHTRLKELLEQCLQKPVAKRFQDMGDVKLELEKVLADPAGVIVQPAPQWRLQWVAAVVLIAAITSVAAWSLKPADPRPVSRSAYALPDGVAFRNNARTVIAVAPDGRSYVYNGTGGLYLRALDELDARLIPGTEGNVSSPFFSPDSQWVGFWDSEGRIEKIGVDGGTPVPIGRAPAYPLAISWGEDDMVLFQQPDGIYRVSANGGTAEPIIEADLEAGEVFSSPSLLPDGKGVLFTVGKGDNWDDGQIVVQSPDPPGERKVVWSGSAALYVPTGHLIYAVGDVLFAIAFDLDTLETRGSAVSLERGLQRPVTSDTAHYGVSDDGTLIYRAGPGGIAGPLSLVWVDREGNEQAIGLGVARYYWPRLSPDGTRLAISIEAEGDEQVWVSDLTRDPPTLTNVTSDPAVDRRPIWTSDGDRIVFASDREGDWGLFSKRADGTGPVETLMVGEGWADLAPYSWSRDGRTLVFGYQDGTDMNIGVLRMDGDREWSPLLDSAVIEANAAISPDGEWIAYASSPTTPPQVYVQRFPELGDLVQVSTVSGIQPAWSDDRRELFYQRLGDLTTMVAVPFETQPSFRPGRERVLFTHQYVVLGDILLLNYAYDSANQRFLMLKAGSTTDNFSASPQIITVQNWFEELKQRVPVR